MTTAATIALSCAQAAAAKPPLVSVTCGQTLTHSVRLANDLTNAGDGLIVGADGVTVDLSGHAIDGDGTPGATGPDAGILDTGRNGVTIKGGTSGNSTWGSVVVVAGGNRLRDLSGLDADAGSAFGFLRQPDPAQAPCRSNTRSNDRDNGIHIRQTGRWIDHNAASGRRTWPTIRCADQPATAVERNALDPTTTIRHRGTDASRRMPTGSAWTGSSID